MVLDTKFGVTLLFHLVAITSSSNKDPWQPFNHDFSTFDAFHPTDIPTANANLANDNGIIAENVNLLGETRTDYPLSIPLTDADGFTFWDYPVEFNESEEEFSDLHLAQEFAPPRLSMLSLTSHDSILEELNGSQEYPSSSSTTIASPSSSSSDKRRGKGDNVETNTARRRKSARPSDAYNDWSRSQPDDILQSLLKKLFAILEITGKSRQDVQSRAKWSRRFRIRANEQIKLDLESNDPNRHKKAIEEISIRQNTQFGMFKIGEIRQVSNRLNKYWQLKDEDKAYSRFIKQMKRRPELIPMARSEDETMIKQAAQLMTPRRYLPDNQQRKPREIRSSSRRARDASNQNLEDDELAETSHASLNQNDAKDVLYDLPYIDP